MYSVYTWTMCIYMRKKTGENTRAYTISQVNKLRPSPIPMPLHSDTLLSVLEVCYRFFLFRPLILFVLSLSLPLWCWQQANRTLYINCLHVYSHNPIMRAHKTAKPMFLNLLLFCSRLCAHKQYSGEHYALCTERVNMYGVLLLLLLVFPMLSDLIGSGFSHRSLVYGNFHSDQIYGYTTNIRLQYNKHIATAAFRI